jgi:octaprenyl-diphosphate synthase
LVGDFLYSRAFQMMVECQNLRILDIVAEATNVIAEGEVMQLMNMHDASLDIDAYLHVIRSKTAKLFEASTRLPAILVHSATPIEAACAQYGQALGTAFQVIDDVLDYDGDASVMGKNLGDDLREGKATLPLIVAMQRGNAAQCAVIQNAIEQGDVSALNDIAQIVRETGAMQATREAASAQAQLALNALDILPSSAYKASLTEVAEQLLSRQS